SRNIGRTCGGEAAMYSSMFAAAVTVLGSILLAFPGCSGGERSQMYRQPGDVVALRYITTDRRIEMAWPCRVVEDASELLALFIAPGSQYKAGPKRSAAEK